MQTDSWLGVELRHLLALQAVAEEGSFGRAARSLGYTQSAISQQIAALERIVGQRLIDRPGGPRPVTLTDAGTLLLTHARAINARLAAAQADLDAFGNGDSGPLSIGTYQSVGARDPPHAAGRVPRRVAEGRCSAGRVGRRPRAARARRARRDRRQLLRLPARGRTVRVDRAHARSVRARRGRRLAARRREKAPTLREILDLPLISYRTCRTTQRVEERLRLAGREPEVVFRSDDNGTVQALVAAGVGVALVPRLTVDPFDNSIAVIDLGDRVPPRIIGVAWHADRQLTPAAQMFIQAAEAVCRSKELAAA